MKQQHDEDTAAPRLEPKKVVVKKYRHDPVTGEREAEPYEVVEIHYPEEADGGPDG